MGIFSTLHGNYQYRKEDKRRAEQGRPSQQAQDDAALRWMMQQTGMVPTEGMGKHFGWDEVRDGIRTCEVQIEKREARLETMRSEGAPVVEQLKVEQEIREFRREIERLAADG